jgi:predicted cupin superfamily sugar epimerase
MQDAVQRIIERFGLEPRPEGGYYREVFRSSVTIERASLERGQFPRRSASTLVYFLITDGSLSPLHRVRGSDELWHLYAGGPLEIHTIHADGSHGRHELCDPTLGEPALVVPGGSWQAARLAPGAPFAFAGCVVAPGFDVADFEMPTADLLAAEYPQHERIIRELARQ